MNDFDYLPSADPAPYASELPDGPLYHPDCGHYHWLNVDCPDPALPCGSYQCCIN
jgi:hypothetical protein